jgi:signal transduction histidine kinase
MGQGPSRRLPALHGPCTNLALGSRQSLRPGQCLMSLRTKFLALFISLGVIPLLALGLLSYGQSTRALEDLLADRTGAIAARAAETLSLAYSRSVSDLLFLANNAESQRILREGSGSEGSLAGGPPSDSIRAEALSFLDTAWRTVGSSWRWAEIRDSAGALVHRMGEPPTEPEPFEAPTRPGGRAEYIVTRPIRRANDETSSAIGSIRGSLLLEEVLPRGELTAGFGGLGYSVVIDRGGDRFLFHPRISARRESVSALLGPGGWNVDPSLFAAPEGEFSYSDGGEARVASFVGLDDPPWTIVSSESLDEFSAPFARTGSVNLIVVLLVTATISTAFLILTRRATDSLRRLTIAADEVAGGNLNPSLPPGGGDEVGKLSGAFSLMVEEVRSMLRRVEESRHMSVIGEFAAQLSHEIRNPLTSIKLNLQRLDRGVREARIPEEYARAVQLSLKEAKRLDGTVRGVLSVSRTRAPRRDPESLHDVIRSAVDAVGPQLEEEKITVETALSAGRDTVVGDRELLKGAFLNLFLNAVEVMDEGGVVRVTTANTEGERKVDEEVDSSGSSEGSVLPPGEGILVRISDDGPGIPDEFRDRIFDPFFTTKEGGSGFGLPLAVRVMEEHAGTLTLAEPQSTEAGATFLVVLPLASPGKEKP